MRKNLSLLTVLMRSAVFALVWWILTEGALDSWWFGIPAILFALIISIALVPPIKFAWLRLFKFIPYFITHSLLGGVDVAWRAFHPRLPIAPTLVEYQFQLQLLPAQVFMLNTVSLLPGTLSASIDEGVLKLHVLDQNKPYLTELQQVEQSVAAIFGLSLQAEDGQVN